MIRDEYIEEYKELFELDNFCYYQFHSCMNIESLIHMCIAIVAFTPIK